MSKELIEELELGDNVTLVGGGGFSKNLLSRNRPLAALEAADMSACQA